MVEANRPSDQLGTLRFKDKLRRESIMGYTKDDVAAALDALVRSGLVVKRGDRYYAAEHDPAPNPPISKIVWRIA